MTQEDKELLLQDLCARLPYGVFVETTWAQQLTDVSGTIGTLRAGQIELFEDGDYSEIKPYLRPMSSVTEEEFQELHSICPHSSFNKTNVPGWIIGISGSDYGRISRIDEISKLIDWLNKKMFDYRKDDEGKTMIEKGLALEAPEGMYK